MLVRIVICSLLLLASSCKPKPVQEERAPLDLANPSPQDVVSQGDAVGTAKVTAQAKGDVVATAPDVRTKTQDVAELAGDAGQKVAVQQPPVDMDQLAKKIQWTLVPKELEVMRNTPVKLGMSWAQAPGGEVVCEWDPGDRTGLLNGCNVDHVFVGGLSDRTVSLRVLVDGKEVLKENRLLPIERLPVQSNPDKDYQLPPPPGEGAGVRVLLASTYSEVTPESTAALVQALTVSKASLVILFLNVPTSAQQAGMLVDGVQALNIPLVPILCDPAGLGEGSPAAIPAPTVLVHSSKAELPFKYSFLHQGTSFTLLDAREREGSVAMEKWLLDEFEQARVASHRLVLSCSALENYTDRDMGTLQPPFRFYEKLMRGDLTLFVSGSQPVFYYGRYGQLPTLAPGASWGSAGVLPGMESAQEGLMAVVDLLPGAPPRVMPIKSSTPGTVVSMKAYPMKVGSYHRVLQPSLGTAPIPAQVVPKEAPVAPLPASDTLPAPVAPNVAPVLPGPGSQPSVLPPGPRPEIKPAAQPVGIYPPPVEP